MKVLTLALLFSLPCPLGAAKALAPANQPDRQTRQGRTLVLRRHRPRRLLLRPGHDHSPRATATCKESPPSAVTAALSFRSKTSTFSCIRPSLANLSASPARRDLGPLPHRIYCPSGRFLFVTAGAGVGDSILVGHRPEK